MAFAVNVEQWRLVDGYEVSSHGRVRNNKTGRILKLGTIRKGYQHVNLSKDGICKMRDIHRLVRFPFK